MTTPRGNDDEFKWAEVDKENEEKRDQSNGGGAYYLGLIRIFSLLQPT
jgi:hypothetical protein